LLIYSFLNANYQIAVISDNFVIHTTDGKFPVTQSFIEELNQRIDQLQMGTGVYLDARADIYVVPDAKSYALWNFPALFIPRWIIVSTSAVPNKYIQTIMVS